MTLPQVDDLFRYWKNSPPEHEMVAMLASVYTTWGPELTAEQTEAAHRKSLEQRWNSGSLNAKQMFEMMGGALSLDGSTGAPVDPANMPGVGRFPGA